MPLKTAFWNEAKARLRAGWRVAIQLTLNVGLAGLFLLLLRAAKPRLFSAQSPWAAAALVPAMTAATLGSVWLAVRFLDRRRWADLGLHLNQRGWWADLGFGLALGIALPLGCAWAGAAVGAVTLEPTFAAGFPGLPFAPAALLSALLYLCIGAFEEIARVYHVRNLAEGTVRGLGKGGAATVALAGAAAISVLMHRGNLAFLAFVLLAAALKGLCYLLTGRAALALAYHAAWNFTVATVLGLGAQGSTTFYTLRFANPAWMPGSDQNELSAAALLVLLGLEVGALLLILAWIRLRYGRVELREILFIYTPPVPGGAP